MTSEHDVDRVLEDWFAQGPSRLPERVITEAVENIDHIKQRRYVLPPGRERMARLLIAGTGLAAALVAAVVGLATLTGGDGVGGPDGVTYTSDRHGYSVFLPSGWTVEEQPGTWEVGEFFDASSEDGTDFFQRLDPGQGPRLNLYLASQPIPTGMSFEQWTATHDDANDQAHPCFDVVATYADVTVDGEPARQLAQHCETFFGDGDDGALTGVQTLVAHNGRGYAIYLWPTDTGVAMPPLSTLQAEAEAWLARFTFTD
jgi:hypothetical protein